MLLNVCGFAFHAIASRRLGVADYGTLYALISLYLIALLPATFLGPVASRYAAEFCALHDDSHVRGLLAFVVRLSCGFGALYVLSSLLFSAQLARFFHVDRWEVPLVGAASAVGLLSMMLRSVAQGAHAYRAYAESSAAEGLVKVGAVFGFGMLGLTMFGAFGSFFAGATAGLLLIGMPLAGRYMRVESRAVAWDWRRIAATTTGAGAIALTTVLIGSVDVLIVKHVFSAHDAGLYSAASLGGKILLYFVGFVPSVLIPQVTDRHTRGERTRHTLGFALAIIAAVGLCGVIFYRFAGSLLLHALYGSQFDAAISLLPGYGLVMALMAGTNALASYGLATHRLAFALPLVITTLATLGVITAVHPTLAAVVTELVIGNVVMLLVVAASLVVQGMRTGARA